MRTQQARLVASLSASDLATVTAAQVYRVASLHAIGVAVVVGPGSIQVWNQSVAMYISTARASSSSTVYPFVKLTLEGQKRQSLSPLQPCSLFQPYN